MNPIKKFVNIAKYTSAAILFSVALSSCSILPQKKAAPVAVVDPYANKLIVWGFEDADAWKPIANDFKATYPAVALVYEKQTLDSNYENRVLNSILSGQGPDIWAMPSDWVYRHKDKLAPMPDALAKKFKIDDVFTQSVGQSVVFNNKIYALTPSASPLIVYYNPTIFKQTLADYLDQHKKPEEKTLRDRATQLLTSPPQTWNDFIEVDKLLTKRNGSNITLAGAALGTDKVLSSQDILYLLMMQNDTDFFSVDQTQAFFNLPKTTASGQTNLPGKQALEFYTSFANPGSPNYTWSDNLGNSIDAFATGKVAMIFGYSDLQNYLLQKYPTLTIPYAKASVPQLVQVKDNFADYARFNTFGVSALSKKPNASWDLIFKICTTSLGGVINSVNHSVGSGKAATYDTSLKNRASNQPEALELATARSLFKGRFPADFDSIMRSAIANTNNGTQDAKGSIDLAANNISILFKKTTW